MCPRYTIRRNEYTHVPYTVRCVRYITIHPFRYKCVHSQEGPNEDIENKSPHAFYHLPPVAIVNQRTHKSYQYEQNDEELNNRHGDSRNFEPVPIIRVVKG